MSFDMSLLSVAGCEVGQPFAFDDALGDASAAHPLNVSVAASASTEAVTRMLLGVCALSGAQNRDRHCGHQQYLTDNDFNRWDLIQEYRRKDRCRWWHGECAE